jgi:peptidoglycan/xylan/chitin deacetylase (PgdA/CDA1 family)
MASITFDDGTIGQYTYARPALVQRSMRATFFIISDALGWTGTNMNAAQVRQLVVDGDEIGNHTRDHPDLVSLTSAQVTAEFSDAQNAIAAQVGVTPTTCAYPYGSHNATVDGVAATYFRGCRETMGGFNTQSSLQPYSLKDFYVGQSTTADDIRLAAVQAKAQGSWVIFTYHGVDPSGAGVEDVTPAHFAEQLDALAGTGIPIVTVSQALVIDGR